MYRQSPNRNQRSKGIKVKHVLQICLLLAVCFWLVYQVKHSHDKKKEFDENDAKSSLGRGNGAFIRLGRKDIHPGMEENTTKVEKHDEAAEEEETTGEDVEENKLEEDEPEDKKDQKKEDEGMGGGDDEIDEHRAEKLDAEVDREEGFVDDEKEKEDDDDDDDDDENETEEKDSGDGNGQLEKENSVEDTNRDGDDTSTHEAREEHYKADDASSAVTHNTQMVDTENENEHDENLNEQPENILEQEFKENNGEEIDIWEKRKELELEAAGEMAKDEKQSIVTNSETEENSLDNSENGSSLNSTVTKGFSDHTETSNSSTENHNLSLPNVTESKSDLDHGQEILAEGTSLEGSNLKTIDPDQAQKFTLDVDGNHLGSNSKGPDETKDSESNSEKLSEASDNTESSTEKNDAIEAEKSDINDGADTLESEKTENPEEIQQDSIDLSDSSNSLEEKDIRTDLDALPEIQTDSEDAGAE